MPDRSHTAHLLLTAALLCFVPETHAGENPGWPHWRGPDRNDISTESSGWDGSNWVADKPVWSVQLGEGCSSPVVVGERFFALSWKGGNDVLACFDVSTGKELWLTSYAAPRYGRNAMGDQGLYSGPTSTPEYDPATGLLYTLSADGDLKAWDVRGSKPNEKWSLNLNEQYTVPTRPKVGRSGRRDYGYTSSPLVLGSTLVVEVGAEEGILMGFDKATGKELWKSEAKGPAGHNGGPVPMTVEGKPCVAVHHFNGLLVTRVDKGNAGKTIAEEPWLTSFGNNVATPAVQENSILLTSSYNQQRIARFDVTLAGSKLIWEQKEASKVCSPVIHDGHVYWAWRQMYCLDFETGKIVWKGGRYGDAGSCVITADDRIVVWANNGDLCLVETAKRSPKQYTELDRKKKVGRDDAWPHVVVAGGRVFCQDRRGNLTCFDILR